LKGVDGEAILRRSWNYNLQLRLPGGFAPMIEKLFPTLGMVINVIAAVFYLVKGKWEWSLYWLLACWLTFVATYLMDKK
jgi:hypothetical protein